MKTRYEEPTLYSGKEFLKELISNLDVSTDMNEAQTRFHILDKIITSSLGWPEDQIEVENCEERKFTDYELGKPRLAIWEAKREGKSFEIPAASPKSLLIDLPSLMELSPDIKDAIVQSQGYCSTRGVQFSIVTNGHQFIAFLATRHDGMPPLSAKALVFKSLDHLYTHFNTAWQYLSYEGIKEKKLTRFLAEGDISIPPKLSSKLVRYPSVRYSSDLQLSLKHLSELLLQDVVESTEVEESFFRHCYCESGALSKYTLLSKGILDARYASIFSSSEPNPSIEPVRKRKDPTSFSVVVK